MQSTVVYCLFLSKNYVYLYIDSFHPFPIYIYFYVGTITIYFVTTFYWGETASFVPMACRLLEEKAKF